jgi:hypothetical protein
VSKFHDLDIDVIGQIRCSIVQWKHMVDAIYLPQQRKEFRLSPNDYLPRDCAQRFGKSDELDRIPQTVIAANQHPLIVEILYPPYALEMTLTRMFVCAGLAVFAQPSIAYIPCALEICASQRVGPVAVGG